jgi:hypothetical protein
MSGYNTTHLEMQQFQSHTQTHYKQLYGNFALPSEIASTYKFMHCRHMTAVSQQDFPTDCLHGKEYGAVCKQRSVQRKLCRNTRTEIGISWMKELQLLGCIKQWM